ncbi:sunset domain-containing protein [Arthrobacter sp. ZGTC412]|uniref:sunset domain-containing protein n=1 Tax=Arthrobacter sp. ZGTC412 TaxID=2058900 RepID=UPI000CE4605D|nr:hypothetical protein [Arthrobacter sp. ZGTC412]
MEFVFLIILLVVLAGVVWWRLNAKKSAAASGGAGTTERTHADGGTRADGALSGGGTAASAEAAGTTGIPGAAGFGAPAEPVAPTAAEEPVETKSTAETSPETPQGYSGTSASAVGAGAVTDRAEGTAQDERRVQDDAEWETQWSEASGPAHVHEGAGRREGAAPASPLSPEQAQPTEQTPVHHPEYTEPHAPTLPGAETAAVEEADDAGTGGSFPVPAASTSRPHEGGGNGAAAAMGLPSDAAETETRDRAQSSALVETGADHTQGPAGGAPAAVQQPSAQEPAGHLAAAEPYGVGSASAAADGSGPADYTVKGDAGAMVYYEEGHPEFEQARAEVWFESAAHAEAAGFRAPRRRRI